MHRCALPNQAPLLIHQATPTLQRTYSPSALIGLPVGAPLFSHLANLLASISSAFMPPRFSMGIPKAARVELSPRPVLVPTGGHR